MPGRALCPNEMYAALVETAGYVPVPLAASDYVELLPATWRKVNAYGVKVGNRTYDCKALTPYRRPALRGERQERALGNPLRPARRHAHMGP